MAARIDHTNQKCVSLGFMRGGNTTQPATVRLQVVDSEMNLEVLLDLDTKQFADLMSGLATWVDDGLAVKS